MPQNGVNAELGIPEISCLGLTISQLLLLHLVYSFSCDSVFTHISNAVLMNIIVK